MRRQAITAAFSFWLLLIHVALMRTTAQDIDRCILNFTVQPITSVDCNVYETDLEVLTCTVESLSTADIADPQDIVIKWFFFNDTEYELAVGVNPPQRTGGNGGHVTVTSTIHISGTSQPNASFVNEGFYHCQVQMIDTSVMSKPSQKFEVFNRDQYLQASTSCSERTFTAPLQSCAVYRIREDTTTTTAVNNDTTTTKTPNDKENKTTDERQGPTSPAPSTSDSSPNTSGGGGGTLEVWIYVLVAVAAVFAMIIVILAIMCVGLCLRRSQTMDANSLKQKENGGMHGNFISHSSSMINNEMYRGGVGIEDTDLTTGTHFTSHSQISDDNYNTLGEREYEVIVSRPFDDTKQEYHRLQRPSPPAVPSGRNGMFGFSPPNGDFRSMSTLTSQMNGMDSFSHKDESLFTKAGYSTLPSRPPPPPYNGDVHVYRELEKPSSMANTMPSTNHPNSGIYHSPTDSSPPDSARYFERGDSSAQLLPPSLPPARGTSSLRKGSSASNDSSLNESLYNPVFGASVQQQPHPLQKIPETGTIFADPPNPTAFPVNEYECIPTLTDYEKPVASKSQKKVGENPKTRVSTKSMNYETDPNLEHRARDTADYTADSSDMTGESIVGFKLPLADDMTTDSAEVEGTSDDNMHFQDRNTLQNGIYYPDNRWSQSQERYGSKNRERRSVSRDAPSPGIPSHSGGLEPPNNDSIAHCGSDIVRIPSHVIAGNRLSSSELNTPSPPPPPALTSSSSLPQYRPNSHQELDTSSLKQQLHYPQLPVGAGTVV